MSWASSQNVTAVMRLPNIGAVDDTVYVILSGMSMSGSVMQVAAGIYPGMASWRAYVLCLRDPSTQAYSWVANDSAPTMSPGDEVSLSMFHSGAGWNYSVADISTGEVASGQLATDGVGGFRPGDQEVMALESYSSTNGVFSGMGSMRLDGLQVDGASVNGGWYLIGGWDPLHAPLFLVGGHQPPSFVSASLGASTATWVYSAEGHVEYVSSSGYSVAAFLGATSAIVALVLALSAFESIKKKERASTGTCFLE